MCAGLSSCSLHIIPGHVDLSQQTVVRHCPILSSYERRGSFLKIQTLLPVLICDTWRVPFIWEALKGGELEREPTPTLLFLWLTSHDTTLTQFPLLLKNQTGQGEGWGASA